MSVTPEAFRVSGIDMTGYQVKDTQRALNFYRDVLGLEPTRFYPDAAGAEYEFADGTTFGLWNGGEHMPWRASAGVMFAVDDFGAAVRNAKNRGASPTFEHESAVCFMAAIEDSEGNRLMIHKRKAV